jgi:hypothetical protein
MNKILNSDGSTMLASIPKVLAVRPTGSQVLVEILTAQELMGTTLTLAENTDLKVPLQGYIRGVGPSFNPDAWGFNLGDRVLISGGGVLAPNYDDTHRDRFFMEPHAIKSVLLECAPVEDADQTGSSNESL